MYTIDFSNWDKNLYEYSIKLIKYKGIFDYDDTLHQVKLNPDADSKIREWIDLENGEVFIESHIWWLTFGLGFESLAKSVILKHQVLELRKRNIPPARILDPNVESVYTLALYYKASARENAWLNAMLVCKGINSVLEIDTGTLGNRYRDSIPLLQNKSKITSRERDQLIEGLRLFADIRRNVDAHTYLKIRVLKSFGNELEGVYIPLINLLINIYFRD